MRYVLSLLLLCTIFHNCMSDKFMRDLLAKSILSVKLRQMEQTRKLQAKTDEPEEPDVTIPKIPSASDLPKDAADTVAPPVVLSEENSTSTQPPTQTEEEREKKSDASLQVKKFHSFRRNTKSKVVQFNILFYYFGRPIVRTIVIRLTIKYNNNRRLRNLQNDIAAESVPSPCVIKDESKVGTLGTGENVDYDCTAPTQSDKPIDSAVVDSSKPMVVGNETVEYDDVKFEPSAIKEAANLADEKKVKTITMVTLNNVTLKNMERNKLELSCIYPENGEKLSSSDKFDMKFYDVAKDGYSDSITCQPTSNTECAIECDTTENPLTFYIQNLTNAEYQSTGVDGEKYITMNIDTSNDDGLLHSSIKGSNTYYRKSSSGLSGGAIAGIVIACVVVLAAASIAAIMLRKPSPAIDNTTVVGLKTVENM